MRKEDIRKVYDGSIFYEIAERRAAEAAEAASKKQKNKKSGMESPKASIDDFVTQTKQAGGDIKAMLDEQINAQRGFLGNAGSRLGNAVSTVFSGKKAPEKTS